MDERRDETAKRGAKSGRAARRLYADLFEPEELAALATAAADADLDQELALLRVLIRRAVKEGEDLETIGKTIARLAQALRVQHVIRGNAARNLDTALAQLLAEIGNEIGSGA